MKLLGIQNITKGVKVEGLNILIDKLWDYRLALIRAAKK